MEAGVPLTQHEEHPSPPPERGLGSRIHARFSAFGGVELELPARHEAPRTPDFDA
jgi:hypothetical protein